jgi:hypothetical protein
MNASRDDDGPYPIGDRQDILEQLSLKALRTHLPEDRFLFRVERADDKGVDGVLEAKVEVRVPKKGGDDEIFGHHNSRPQDHDRCQGTGGERLWQLWLAQGETWTRAIL